MNKGRQHKGLKRPSSETVARIRKVKEQNPDLSFNSLKIRFGIDAGTIAKIVNKKYPYDLEE